MKPKPEARDEGSKMVLDHAVEHGLEIIMMPNGAAFVQHHPDYSGIAYHNAKWFGAFLAAIIVDGGGHWELKKKKGSPFEVKL